MSMLAERRTKKKWCLNPNGKDWSKDDNKFGQRMLEKMGWKKGCGLGVNLQGMKEHVRISAKNDTKGLGCKKNSDSEWIHHQQNFENLLSELACTTFEEIRPPGPSEAKPVSLEEKSKKSQVRVHYQKYTRGKDVSRYSANDLACILGKKCSSLDSKSFAMQYSCNVNTGNISEADTESCMISNEYTVGQSLNLCEEKTNDDCLPSRLPKHRAKNQSVFYSTDAKGVQEKQNDTLKEIKNKKENSISDMDVVHECTSDIEDNSASHFCSESVEKISSKRKKNCVNDSEDSQEVFTETMISCSQEEVNEYDTVAHEVEETDIFEEEKKKWKKKKKDKKNKAKVENENGKEDKHTKVTSNAEKIGNKELENACLINETDTWASQIETKRMGKLYKTHISEEHKEPPEMKKRKKKKMFTQSLNEPDDVGNITSEIVSPLLPDNRDGVNSTQRSICSTSESFFFKEELHQYDSISAVKHRKSFKKCHREDLECGFRGSNLGSIPGYGCLPSQLPKHRANNQFVFYSTHAKGVQEKQNDILNEIKNKKEKILFQTWL